MRAVRFSSLVVRESVVLESSGAGMYSNVLIMPWIKAFRLPNSLACGHAVSAAKRLYLLTDIRLSSAAAPHALCIKMQTFAHVFLEN
jgi:hypothetical protein